MDNRIITVITPDNKTVEVGPSAEVLLERLPLKTNDSTFIKEVERKLKKGEVK